MTWTRWRCIISQFASKWTNLRNLIFSVFQIGNEPTRMASTAKRIFRGRRKEAGLRGRTFSFDVRRTSKAASSSSNGPMRRQSRLRVARRGRGRERWESQKSRRGCQRISLLVAVVVQTEPDITRRGTQLDASKLPRWKCDLPTATTTQPKWKLSVAKVWRSILPRKLFFRAEKQKQN